MGTQLVTLKTSQAFGLKRRSRRSHAQSRIRPSIY